MLLRWSDCDRRVRVCVSPGALSGNSESAVISISSEQLLLQATHLRNTDFVYGIAVYTGREASLLDTATFARCRSGLSCVPVAVFAFVDDCWLLIVGMWLPCFTRQRNQIREQQEGAAYEDHIH